MTKDEHGEAVAELKTICKDIGCSGMSPDMCQNAPQRCDIIRKVVFFGRTSTHVEKSEVNHS